MTKELRVLSAELDAIELWDANYDREQPQDFLSRQAHAGRQTRRVVIADKIMQLTIQALNEIYSGIVMPRRIIEEAIAALEMRVTTLRMQAERIGRLASQVQDEAQRCELWAVAMDLEEETRAIKHSLHLLWKADTSAPPPAADENAVNDSWKGH